MEEDALPQVRWGKRYGAHLERARGRALLSRAQLAQRLGVAEESVRRWETGQSRPSPERLARLIAVLSIDGASLMEPDRVSDEVPPLARELRRERVSRGAVQTEAARALGVSAATYASWESGRTTPPDRYVGVIATFLGLPDRRVVEMGGKPFVVNTRNWPPLGQLLGRQRQANRLTREELARLVGVAPATIVAWELGHRRPRPQQLRDLAFVIGVGVQDIERAMPPGYLQLPMLGQVIRTQQARLGLSLRDVASRAGVDAATLSRWMHGVNQPGVSSLRRLAGALNLPLSALLPDSGALGQLG